MFVGKVEAQSFHKFAGAYHLVRSASGSMCFEGYSPDGKQNYTCERCCQSLMNVYVFENDNKEYMHVGIDCAEKMGVPLSELKSAKRYYADAERTKNALSAKERQDAFIAANKLKFANEIEFLESLLIDTPVSEFEQTVIKQEIAGCENDLNRSSNMLAQILTRLTLCKTSKPVTEKLKQVQLTAYRKCIVLDGYYGATFINFLTDGITAYVYKGSAYALDVRDTITANWSVAGTDVRDGLTANVIQRPSKAVMLRYSNTNRTDGM